MFNLVLALLAGVVTVAAPCTLPMLPILLGASVGQTGRARPAMIALGFVVSFSMVALAANFGCCRKSVRSRNLEQQVRRVWHSPGSLGVHAHLQLRTPFCAESSGGLPKLRSTSRPP